MTKYRVGSIIFAVFGVVFLMLFLGMLATKQAEVIIGFAVPLVLCITGAVANQIAFCKTRPAKQGGGSAEPPAPARQAAQTPTPAPATEKSRASVSGKLVDGLPVPSETSITAVLFDSKILLSAFTGFGSGGCERFEIAMEKVQNAAVLTEKEVKQIVSQSAPGMIIGAAAFGLLGAMVGGRVKTTEKTKLKYLFVLNYNSEGEQKQILLNLPENLIPAQNFISKLKKTAPKNSGTVKL